LRKQHGEAERYYVKRIQELETGCREVENRLSSKEQEIMMLKQDINNLNSRVKEEESNIAINNSRYPRLIEQLQESNRSLTKEISELSERIRLEQERFYVAEQKISAAEMRATASEQKAVYAEHRANERVNMQDLTRQSMENEKKRLLEEIGQMRENNNKLLEETAKLRE
jgi:prefoldin subunit 5